MTRVDPGELRRLADSDLTDYQGIRRDKVKALRDACRQAASEIEAARRVVETSRAIARKYPGGKLLWFSEFSDFEAALAAYDQLGEAEREPEVKP